MLFNNLEFMLMVAMLGYVNSQSKDIPICEPPALACSVFKRSVCEWSDSGEPVWACRGFFEDLNTGPIRSQQLPAEIMDVAKQDAESEVTIGTYEYKVHQGDSKVVSQNDSSETDVKYVTYTYPIITKIKKNGASQIDSKSEVKVETTSTTGQSSSISKTESASKVDTGPFSLPVASANSSELKVKNSSVTKDDTVSSEQTGSNTLVSPGKSVNVAQEDTDSDVHVETHTLQIPGSEKNSVSKIVADSHVVHVETHTAQVNGAGTDKVAQHTESKTTAQMEALTDQKILSSEMKSKSLDETDGSRKVEAAKVQSDSEITSNPKSSSAQRSSLSEVKASFTNTESDFKSGRGSAVGCEKSQGEKFETNQVSAAEKLQHGIQTVDSSYQSVLGAISQHRSLTNAEGSVRSRPPNGLDINGNTHQQYMAGYLNSVKGQQHNSQLNSYPGSISTAAGNYGQSGNSQYTVGVRTSGGDYGYLGRLLASIGSTADTYLNSGSHTNSAGHYQQYQTNSAVGSSSAHQNYGLRVENQSPFSYPYYSGYQSLERGSSALSRVSANNGLYYWPQSRNPTVNIGMGGVGHGSNWLAEHYNPLVNRPQNGLVPPQGRVPLPYSGFYGSACGISGTAASTITSSQNYPSIQNFISKYFGASNIDWHPCSFCKKLLSVYDGAAICDVLAPLILDLLDRVFDILCKRLRQ